MCELITQQLSLSLSLSLALCLSRGSGIAPKPQYITAHIATHRILLYIFDSDADDADDVDDGDGDQSFQFHTTIV